MKFPGQRQGERVMMIIDKHWIGDLKVVAQLILLGFIPVFLYLYLIDAFFTKEIQNNQLMILFFFSFYLLCIFLYTFISWLNHELDVIIVTNERVINHDQVSFLNRQVAEAYLDQIQDIRGSEKGFLQTILHYGVIEIRTAADVVIFKLKDARKPFENSRKILDIRDQFKHIKHK